MPENYPIYPFIPNLYVFSLDLEMLDARATGTRIRSLHAESNNETFLIITDRMATSYYVQAADVGQYPDLTNNEKFYIARMIGEEPTGGVYYFSAASSNSWEAGEYDDVINLTLEKLCPKVAMWAWDVSPCEAIQARHPEDVPGTQLRKIIVHGPALKDGYVGMISRTANLNSNLYYQYFTGYYTNRSGDLDPQWCVARMDLGLTLLDRVDLESDAQDLVEMGDHYYVVTKGLRPYTQWPASIALHPTGSYADFRDIYAVMYFPTPSGNIPDGTMKYVECTGGEVVNNFGTFTKAVTIVPGQLPFATGSVNNIALYFYGETARQYNLVSMASSTSLQLLAYRIANATLFNGNTQVTSSPTTDFSNSEGGCIQRATPRRNIYKLKKDDLSIVNAGEWDHSLFAAPVLSNIRLATTGESLVITGGASRYGRHLLNTRAIGGQDQILFVNGSVPFPRDNYEITFTLNGNAITSTMPLTAVTQPPAGFDPTLVAGALMAYFGPGTLLVQSNLSLRFTGKWHATRVNGIGYRIKSTVDPDEAIVNGSFPDYEHLRGSPDALTVQPLYSTIYLGARFWEFTTIRDVPSPRADEFRALTISFTKDGQEISSCPLTDVLYGDRFGPGEGETEDDDFYDEYGGPFDPIKVMEQLADTFGAANLHLVGNGFQSSAISYDGSDPSVVHCKIGYVIKGTWSNHVEVGLYSQLQTILGTDIDGDVVPDKPVILGGEFNAKPVGSANLSAAQRSGFTYGWDISGRLTPEKTYRIRYQTTPGYQIQYGFAQNFGAITGNVPVAWLRFAPLSGCDRVDTFKIWYDGNSTPPLTIDLVREWPDLINGNGLQDDSTKTAWNAPTGAGTRIAAALTALTGVLWKAAVPQTGGFFQADTRGMVYRSAVTDVQEQQKLYEYDPLWLYSEPLRLDASVGEVETALQSLGFIEARLFTRSTLMNGPIRFTHYNGLMTPIDIDYGDDEYGNSRVVVGPAFEEEDLLPGQRQRVTPYPKTSNNAINAEAIVHNRFGEYFVHYPTGFQQQTVPYNQYQGAQIVKYNAQHEQIATVQVVASSGIAPVMSVDRFDNLLVVTADALKIYDRNLDVVGIINRPTNIIEGVWGRQTSLYPFGGNAVTDRHQNYYVLGQSSGLMIVFKFNQLFQYVASFELPEAQYGSSGRQLICVGDYLVMAKIGINQTNNF